MDKKIQREYRNKELKQNAHRIDLVYGRHSTSAHVAASLLRRHGDAVAMTLRGGALEIA